MAAKTEAALTKQLEHKKWLAKHLRGTKQQRDSLRRILVLRTALTQQTHKHTSTAHVSDSASAKEKERTRRCALSVVDTNR